MKNVYKAKHIATSPNTKQQIKKFKEEFADEMPWDKFRAKDRK